jgi:FKBP-type peptidyl-prolyl cis-trans isomerase
MMNKAKYLILLLLVSLFACNEKPKKPVEIPKKEMKQSMETANRYLLNEEEEEIEHYVQRHGLEMVRTGTGLRYQIIRQGDGKQIENGDVVSLDYELYSLKGELIYSSEKEGVKTFKVGEGGVESGLNEAMTYLHYGDVAKLIIPFHLAYGLHGDDNKIPEYATLVYTIKVIENQ